MLANQLEFLFMLCMLGVGRVGSRDTRREGDSGERGYLRDTGEFALEFLLLLPLLSAVTSVNQVMLG